MTDRLTQLQDAVDQLATQMVASINYVKRHHNYTKLHPTDEVRQIKAEGPQELNPHPEATFQANLVELAQDLVICEQQVEALISSLPGIGHSEQEQEKRIRELEIEMKEVEVRRREALLVKQEILERLEKEISVIRRP